MNACRTNHRGLDYNFSAEAMNRLKNRGIYLVGLGFLIWLAVTIFIFSIARSRQTQNELFEEKGRYADGTILREFSQFSPFLVWRNFANRAYFIVCSYGTVDGQTVQGAIEVEGDLGHYYHVGDTIKVVYLATQPSVARVMIPAETEYHDLYASDMYVIGIFNVILGAAVFLTHALSGNGRFASNPKS